MNPNNIPDYILMLLLAFACFAVYANSLNGEFLIDDQQAILNNQNIHDIKVYFSQYFKIRPGALSESANALLWHISQSNPFAYHLFNVILHAGCTVLLFLLCNILFANKTLSFFSGLIFAVHPIHTEVVSWVSGGHYAFSALFFISALIFYIKSERSIFYLLLAVTSFGLCLFTGNAAATLPVMFIFYELFFNRTPDKRLRIIRLSILALMLAISALFVGAVFLGKDKYIHTIFYFRGLGYLIVIAKALAYYLKILYMPIERGLYHPFGYNTGGIQKLSPAFFISLTAILTSVFLFFKCRKKALPLSFGIGWFFVTYLPYSNIIPVCNIISERYMYLPSWGFSLIIAYLALEAWRIINKNTLYRTALRCAGVAAVTLFLGSYSLLTLKHNLEYSNIITYWETNINNFPDGYMAYNNLAGTYYSMGQREQAIAYCWVNLMINPGQPHVWCNLGKVYREKGALKQAEQCYREALKIDKGYLPALKGLAEIKK